MNIIDVHTHGIANYDTRDAIAEDILKIAEIHGAFGVNTIILTIYSGPIDQMRHDIQVVKDAMEMQAANSKSRGTEGEGLEQRTVGITDYATDNMAGNQGVPVRLENPARILGVHLEGPFLNPKYAGALNKKSFLPADIYKCEQLLEGLSDVIRIVTIAPELYGAPALINALTDLGVIVSMGHSDATYSETEEGFNSGAKGITHIFNVMRFIHHREPGMAGFALTNPHIYIEVIADPYHLHRKTIELIFSAKKLDRIIIVSDSVKGTHTGGIVRRVSNATGTLLGGSMVVTESAAHVAGMGIDRETAERCITENPERYLSP